MKSKATFDATELEITAFSDELIRRWVFCLQLHKIVAMELV
jgi:hypothetical protein